MNQTAWLAGAALVAAAGVGVGYWTGARNAVPPTQPLAQGTLAAPAKGAPPERMIRFYRNPMGLPDTSPVPKKDATGMDYIAVYEGASAEPGMPAGTVKIAPDKVQILGVRSEAAALRDLRRVVFAVGTIQVNERLLYRVAPRFEGWIEKLHVNTTGQAVSRGEPLMEVYSPDLLTTQEEYLIAVRGARDLKESGADAQALMQRLAESALRRLRNWEISERELQELQHGGQARRLLVYRSAANGIVLQKSGVQGMRFMPGEVLFEIADLSSVWMIADVAEQDVGLVRVGQEAKLRIDAYPDKAYSGKVVFLYPTFDGDTRTAKVRIELANPGRLLKPAMFANVELIADRGQVKPLAVPESAVLDSGARQVVLVRRGEGLFEPRTVKLGVRAGGSVAVSEGLTAGEEVVVRANFLIDAESNLKAALDGFGGHSGHGGTQAKPAPVAAPQDKSTTDAANRNAPAAGAVHKGH